MSESFTSFINLCGFVHQLKPVLDYIAHQENADSSLAALMGWDVMEVGGGDSGSPRPHVLFSTTPFVGNQVSHHCLC